MLIELKSTNNARHEDSSVNINESIVNNTYANNANNNLLHNHMLYCFNKLKKIKKALIEYNESI